MLSMKALSMLWGCAVSLEYSLVAHKQRTHSLFHVRPDYILKYAIMLYMYIDYVESLAVYSVYQRIKRILTLT